MFLEHEWVGHKVSPVRGFTTALPPLIRWPIGRKLFQQPEYRQRLKFCREIFCFSGQIYQIIEGMWVPIFVLGCAPPPCISDWLHAMSASSFVMGARKTQPLETYHANTVIEPLTVLEQFSR